MSYFPEPYTHSKSKVKDELHLASYATNSDLKSTGIVTSKYAKKADLATLIVDKLIRSSEVDKLDIKELKKVPSGLDSLKNKVDKIDIDKSKSTPIELIKLSNVVKNGIIKKTEHDELVKKKLVLFRLLLLMI